MNRRDQELLDKQLHAIHPESRHDGVLMLALAAMFFVGMTLGGLLAGDHSPSRVAANDAAMDIAALSATPSMLRQ